MTNSRCQNVSRQGLRCALDKHHDGAHHALGKHVTGPIEPNSPVGYHPLNRACEQLLEIVRAGGANHVEVSVSTDGRVALRLYSDAGYTLRSALADLSPGGAHELPSVAIRELLSAPTKERPNATE